MFFPPTTSFSSLAPASNRRSKQEVSKHKACIPNQQPTILLLSSKQRRRPPLLSRTPTVRLATNLPIPMSCWLLPTPMPGKLLLTPMPGRLLTAPIHDIEDCCGSFFIECQHLLPNPRRFLIFITIHIFAKADFFRLYTILIVKLLFPLDDRIPGLLSKSILPE